EFMSALEDDLNTPLAIARLHGLATEINRAPRRQKKYGIRAKLRAAGNLLGVLQEDPQIWLQGGRAQIGTDLIEKLIEQRDAARKAKDYEKADSIRKELANHGVVLEDRPDGTFWRMAG
ncbi:MAG: DALR domain-containing protein, partial [Alphaproteobacteria bacterium]